jgi:O-antigen/teichoic acid export membrane protein
MSLTRQAISGVKWNSLATVAKIGIQFISMAVLARLLAPEDFGLMGMAVVVTGLLNHLLILDLATPSFIVKILPASNSLRFIGPIWRLASSYLA